MTAEHPISAGPHTVRRRDVILTGGAAAAAAVAGCLGGQATTPDPVALTGGLQCDACGMIVEKHPGPDGQLFYRDERPEGHENPARFDSLKQCFFPYRLEHEQLGWSVAAAYVTDYSAVDFTVQTQGGTTIISSHPEADAFAPAPDLQYVVGSEVEGAMGPDFIPFSRRGDAESFAAEHDGDILAFDDIDEGVIGR